MTVTDTIGQNSTVKASPTALEGEMSDDKFEHTSHKSQRKKALSCPLECMRDITATKDV